ncbi:Uncharacterised protein [Sphingobacterium multivorum]|uniref:hypothetical protein n=1 Tax=Sphingobacterium multivorum TaxID=28454 RepID=UPI000DFC74A5|nr:hypothetical protein [Sphingobacterium multivorum]QQT43369.1 hypothetical protein I6J00_16620 [Sphingobacterium multivorum]SUI98445.1 Uncharacterised protein [Sphingobacterium multivorum]
MATALIKCPKTGKPLRAGVDLPKNFREMNISIGKGTISPCPHCGDSHEWVMNDLFFEEQ